MLVGAGFPQLVVLARTAQGSLALGARMGMIVGGSWGIAGIMLLLAGVAMTWYEYGAMVGLGTTVAVLALVGVAISVSLKSASSGRLSKSDLILNDTETPPSENADMQLLVGKEGVVKNTLRPVGTAEFDCGKLHVTSDGEYVSEGQKVRIVRVEGTQIFVNKI